MRSHFLNPLELELAHIKRFHHKEHKAHKGKKGFMMQTFEFFVRFVVKIKFRVSPKNDKF